MFRHVLDQRQETPLGVVPRVGAEFLLVRLQAFDHSRYAELVVALGAVQRAGTQIISLSNYLRVY